MTEFRTSFLSRLFAKFQSNNSTQYDYYKASSSPDILPLAIIIFPILIIIIRLMIGFTNPTEAARTLESSGYSEIKLNGWAGIWSCGEGDTYADEFSATNPSGKRVTGVVCCGLFKGCTVRF